MGRVSHGRAFCVLSAVVVLTLLVLGGSSPAALAGQRYYYKATGVDYTAAAELTGAVAPDCVGTEIWSGKVSSEGQLAPLADFARPGVHFTVGAHGTTGSGFMRLALHSNLYDATDRLTTACQDGGETAFANTPCTQQLDGRLSVAVTIRGGVGTRLKLEWTFIPHSLVPIDFRCAKRWFEFPDADKCTTRTTLSAFNHKSVSLPFRCSSGTAVPPRGGYVTFAAAAHTTGAIHLKRTPWPRN